jgi:hypothetical protein
MCAAIILTLIATAASIDALRQFRSNERLRAARKAMYVANH